MKFFRKHWLLVLLLVIAILWWQLFDSLKPPIYPQIEDVDYWAIVTDPTLSWIGGLGLVVIFILILVQVRRISKFLFRLSFASMILLFCGGVTYSLFYDMRRSKTIEHRMTVQYDGKPYHLAFSTTSGFWDVIVHQYYVFECDALDHHCSMIFSEPAENTYNTKIWAADNNLLYQRDTVHYQILPKTY